MGIEEVHQLACHLVGPGSTPGISTAIDELFCSNSKLEL